MYALLCVSVDTGSPELVFRLHSSECGAANVDKQLERLVEQIRLPEVTCVLKTAHVLWTSYKPNANILDKIRPFQ